MGCSHSTPSAASKDVHGSSSSFPISTQHAGEPLEIRDVIPAPAPALPTAQLLSFPTPLVVDIGGMYAGLNVVHYSGGCEFRVATSILHRRLSASVEESLKQRIRVACEAALCEHAEVVEPTVLLPTPRGVDWSQAEWRRELSLWMPPPGCETLNLFFQGWLWPEGREGRMADTAYPLVGLFDAKGELGYLKTGSLGLLGDGPLCEEGGVVKPSENHFHLVDPWAGGSREEYEALLVEAQGLLPYEAAERAEVEEILANEPHLGADMARFIFGEKQNVNEEEGKKEALGWGSGTAVAVDLRLPARPRILVSTVCVVTGSLRKSVEDALAPFRVGGEVSPMIAALGQALPCGFILTQSLQELLQQPVCS